MIIVVLILAILLHLPADIVTCMVALEFLKEHVNTQLTIIIAINGAMHWQLLPIVEITISQIQMTCVLHVLNF